MHRSIVLTVALLPIVVAPACFNPGSAGETDAGTEADASTSTGGVTTLEETTQGASSSSGTVDPTLGTSTTTSADTSSSTTVADSSSTSSPEPICGNGKLEDGEECDDGEANADEPDACRADCVLPTCGDGIVDTDEECDSEATDCLRDCTLDTLEFGDFPAAVAVLGQPDMTSNGMSGLGFAFRFPAGVYENDGRIYMSNGQGSGVFIWNSLPTEGGVLPDDVIGRVSVQGDAIGFGPSSVGGFVRGLSSDGDTLAIVDGEGPRVLLFDGIPTTATPADVVLGQPNFTTQESATSQDRFADPRDVYMANDRIVVADSLGHRVLVWNLIPDVNGALPVVVLGQENFNEGEPNRGEDAPDADTLSLPSGVWTDGSRIAVADTGNNRLLLWDAFPTENGQPADHVIGQADMTSGGVGAGSTGFNTPLDVVFEGNRFYVPDVFNHRIMLFTGWPTSNGLEADAVIGQSNFDNLTSNDTDQNGIADDTPSARTLARPGAVYVAGNRLLVADGFNHRGLVFEALE